MLSCGVYQVFREWCLQTTTSETCCFIWSVLKLAQIRTRFSLREKCSSKELFLVGIFPQLDLIQRDMKYSVPMGGNTDQKNSVSGHFSRSVLYYNLQFRLPILTSLLIPWNYNANTIDTAIIRSSRQVVFFKKGIHTNFAKFLRKHLY